MHADYSVELGPDDDVLEIPWSSPNGSLRYYDLRLHPELIDEIAEAVANPALKEFLVAVNGHSAWSSAKCDVWYSEELNPEEDIYGGRCKFGSYVDLVLADQPRVIPDGRPPFEAHERLLKRLVQMVEKAPEIPASTEFILRRCYLHRVGSVDEGFYVTLYVFGYGADAGEARRRWADALNIVQNPVLQVSK